MLIRSTFGPAIHRSHLMTKAELLAAIAEMADTDEVFVANNDGMCWPVESVTLVQDEGPNHPQILVININ